jgi:TRAP transporter TAXI family solute receptor
MKRKSFFIIVTVTCVALSILSFSSVQAAPELIPLFSPAPGGTAYTLSAGVVVVTNKYMADVQLLHAATTGTMEIIRRMMERDATNKPSFGAFAPSDGWRALKGQGEYAAKPFTNLRSVLFINAADRADSGIKSYADAKGKRIGVGPAGSTVSNSSTFILDAHGVNKKDYKPYYYNYREVVEGIQDGSLDGGFLGGGYPIAAFVEISIKREVRLVPVDEELMKKVIAEHPYFYKTIIKAKSYKGVDVDTPIYGFTTVIHTNAGTSNDLVYRFIKNLFDHKEDYYAIHGTAREMTKENATKGMSVPLHLGAERYLKEIGAVK